jgi:hypothetical protein
MNLFFFKISKLSVIAHRSTEQDHFEMNFDLKFDYGEALKRHNLSQSQVDALKESAKNFPIVPKSLTNKQVIAMQIIC